MASCAYCGSALLFEKKKVGNLQFCNDTCAERGDVVVRAQAVPESKALDLAIKMRHSRCPVCHGPGPVDIHESHAIWSAVVISEWKSTPVLCCKSCGLKAQGLALLQSALVGWWGFPWGLAITPLQIVKNVAGMLSKSSSSGPSPKLRYAARLQLAAEIPSPPPPTAPV